MQPRRVQRVAVRGVDPGGQPVSARWLRHGERPVDAVDPAGPHPVTLRGVGSRVVGLEALGLLVHEIVVELELSAGDGASDGVGDGAGDGVRPGSDLYRTPPPDDLVDHLDAGVDTGPAGVREAAVRVQRPGAYALVLDGASLLLTRQAYGGEWTLPGGGIDFGEHPESAVRREVHEETGLALGAVRLLDADSEHWVGRSPRGRLEDFHAVRILYAAGPPEGAGPGSPLVVEVGGSTDAAAWVPVAALGRLQLGGSVRMALPHLPDPPVGLRFS